MAWQDLFPLPGARIDAEEERELRLVAQARGGADWALAALIARYQPTVSRYLSRLTGSVEQSRVLAERIFRQMDRRIRGPQGGKQLRLWLLRTSTEMGLDALREPKSRSFRALSGPHGPAGLLPGEAAASPLRRRLNGLSDMTSKTSRQVRKLIWSSAEGSAGDDRESPVDRQPSETLANDDPFSDLDPREALRFKMIRAVLAELPYGDAQCLALHLIAGLNQAEVARALGITGSATRKRVVHGLQLFALRYEAAAASLRLPPESTADHEAPLFGRPALDREYGEPQPRLHTGDGYRVSAGAPTPPPSAPTQEPPRVVPENPEERFEDESPAALVSAIEEYDLANEATVVMDPLVVEAVSTLPAIVPNSGELSTVSQPEERWYDGELVAALEPHIAIGSIPLSETPLSLEVVDEPLDIPERAIPDEPPAQVDDAAPASVDEAPGAELRREDAPVIAEAEPPDEIVMIDLAAMTSVPLVASPDGARELGAAATDLSSEPAGDHDDAPATAKLVDLDADPDDVVSIAEIHDPEIVALSGSPAGAGEAGEPLADAGSAAAASPDRPDAESSLSPSAAQRSATAETERPLPRRVPVLTVYETSSQQTASIVGPRVVPVLTPDAAPAQDAESPSRNRRTPVEQPSLR